VAQLEFGMKENVHNREDQRSSCRCGSSLKLDVLSLNRKLLGEEARKVYCLACMADLFECALEDVVGKLDAFKQEGCRLFLPQA
jgi:hypothetical protein